MDSTGSNSSAEPARAARADIVVGLTSYNDARTIGAVVRAVEGGLSRYFESSAARIVLADARSADGTREAARAASSGALIEVDYPSPKAFAAVSYHGYPGRP